MAAPAAADRVLAEAAARKTAAGEKPTELELAAVARIQREDEAQQRWAYYRTVPKKDYLEMAGRPAQVVNEQGRRWNLPIDGPVIDLPKVVFAFHEFLAANHKRLGERGDGPATRKLQAEAALLEMKQATLAGKLWRRSDVEPGIMLVFDAMRQAIEALQKAGHQDAADMVQEWVRYGCQRWEQLLAEIAAGNAAAPPDDTDEDDDDSSPAADHSSRTSAAADEPAAVPVDARVRRAGNRRTRRPARVADVPGGRAALQPTLFGGDEQPPVAAVQLPGTDAVGQNPDLLRDPHDVPPI